MTPQTILDIALRRAGLTVTNQTYRDNGIDYANMTMAELLAMPWVFRHKQGTFTTSSGTSEYDLASDVAHTRHFKDTTNNCSLKCYAQNSNAHIGTTSSHDLIFDCNFSGAQ